MLMFEYYFSDSETINETTIDIGEPLFIPSSKPVGLGIDTMFVHDRTFDELIHFSIYDSFYNQITTPSQFRKFGFKNIVNTVNQMHIMHLIEREIHNKVKLQTGENFYKQSRIL